MFISEAFAQAVTPPVQGGIIGFLTPLVVVIAIFYMLVWRPQGKRMKAHTEMIGSLTAGDKVITTGGIHGTVVKSYEDTVILEISKNMDITVNLQSVTVLVEKGNGRLARYTDASKKPAKKSTKKIAKKSKKAA